MGVVWRGHDELFKPSNVLLADDGRVVLTDFGIAAVEGDATLTGSGTLLGSPAYLAPERATGERATTASDLWIRIEAVNYQQEAADWEFTYAGDGGRRHVLNRGFITGPNQAYAIYWSTPAEQWENSLDYFDVFTTTFQPGD